MLATLRGRVTSPPLAGCGRRTAARRSRPGRFSSSFALSDAPSLRARGAARHGAGRRRWRRRRRRREPARRGFTSCRDLAGALEPCGCVKDQLGGMDHFGALVTAREEQGVRPTRRSSPGRSSSWTWSSADEKKSQEIAKAETIAATLKTLGLAAFAPVAKRLGGRDGDAREAPRRERRARCVAANLERRRRRRRRSRRCVDGRRAQDRHHRRRARPTRRSDRIKAARRRHVDRRRSRR